MLIEKEKSQVEIKIPRTPNKDSGENRPWPKSLEILDDLFKSSQIHNYDTSFLGGPQKRSSYRLSLWMWLASFIDLCVIAAMTSAVVFSFLFLLRYNPNIFYAQFFTKAQFFLTLTVLSVFMGWMYYITCRSFSAATVGESACSLRLGQPSDRLLKNYVSKVIFRTTLTLATGIITFPFLSLVFGKDLMGELTGLRIYSLK